jgi:hypothetical protein
MKALPVRAASGNGGFFVRPMFVLLRSKPPALPSGEGVGGREGCWYEAEGGGLATPAPVPHPKAASSSAADLRAVLLLAATGAS